jgi:hypothetical protein
VSVRIVSEEINMTGLIKLIPGRDSERKDRETGQARSRLKNPSYVSPYMSDAYRGTIGVL